MVRYSAVWYGIVWYGTVQYGMVWYRTVWYGMVPNGTVWYGMVGYGTLWQGVFFPAGVRVFPTGNLKNPQEILTKTLIIEQIL